MLGGQKAPYKLLVRALDQCTGLEIPSITYVASEDFVVCNYLLLLCTILLISKLVEGSSLLV